MKSSLRRTALSFPAVLAIAFLTGCATGPTIRTHADSAVRYENYTSFALIRPTQFMAGSSVDVTPDLIRQTRQEVETAFLSKGLVKTSHASADLLVLVHGGVAQKLDVTEWGYSYGRFGRGFAPGPYELNQHKEGTLLIDVFDAKTREIVWRGTAVASVSETPTPEAVKAAAEAVVARYPN